MVEYDSPSGFVAFSSKKSTPIWWELQTGVPKPLISLFRENNMIDQFGVPTLR